MNKNEIVARWMGVETKDETSVYPLLYKAGPLRHCKDGDYPDHTYYSSERLMYDRSYEWLMLAWMKFRDLKLGDNIKLFSVHSQRCYEIELKITRGTITEAFEELVKGIEWYESLKK